MTRRIKLEVFVDLDAVPGPFNTEASAAAIVETVLNQAMPHYNPTVSNPTTLSDRLDARQLIVLEP